MSFSECRRRTRPRRSSATPRSGWPPAWRPVSTDPSGAECTPVAVGVRVPPPPADAPRQRSGAGRPGSPQAASDEAGWRRDPPQRSDQRRTSPDGGGLARSRRHRGRRRVDRRGATAPPRVTPTFGTVVPGFVDLQVNGVDDVDVATADGADWDRLDPPPRPAGWCDAWCPTLVTAPLDRLPVGDRPHRSRPYVDPTDRAPRSPASTWRARSSAVLPAHTRADSAAHRPRLGGGPPDDVVLVTLAPELDQAADATRLLADPRCPRVARHSTPTPDQVDACVRAGARLVTHLYNGMSGLHHRSPGLAALALVDDRLAASIIADGVHVDPAMMRLAWRAKPTASSWSPTPSPGERAPSGRSG